MARIECAEAVNSPGNPGKTGDDRFGFDAAAGTAWVLDGATDVTPLKPFPDAESGAAWVADALSKRLMVKPPDTLDAHSYWRDVMTDVRQRAWRETAIPLDSLPPEARPIASGIWLRRLAGRVELAWMGDCLALDLHSGQIYGATDAIARETEDSTRLVQQSTEDQWDAARQARIATNQGRTPIFGLDPEKADSLSLAEIDAGPGTSLVLMSDGFYRLVEPYGLASGGPALAAMIREIGLSSCIERLRAFEAEAGDGDIARIKPSDDACALHIQII